ncbi:hypothetical protein BASA60_006261 [Batrachochytrium salamandrivorans]|nr:hypothetical protein BASA60_006261 [Batrachochytrium salamandrivorans]
MKHPVFGVLSIFSISVYAASIPDYVENTPLLVKRQVYPDDPSTDSMYQSLDSDDEYFDFSKSQLGMMPSDVDLFSGEQEGASHSFNELDLSDSTTRTMSETPSNNDPDTPFGGQPEQQLEEAYSSDAITVGGKARISPCPDGSIPKGLNAKCHDDVHVLSKILEGNKAGKMINELLLKVASARLQILKIKPNAKMWKEHITKLKAQKKEQLDTTGSANLQTEIDASVMGCISEAKRAEKLTKEIHDDMEKVGKAYNRQRNSYEEVREIFNYLTPEITLSSFGIDDSIDCYPE